ncbi:MAG: formate dehydrogenase accessory sulfurtransferase FdhD [Flavobacteriales bacterium]|nr:formate dehydrogenase accessory sulfurtransferase FdhD [Flavobacteriales bacterium]
MIQSKSITKYSEGSFFESEDAIALEAPLEIRLGFGSENEREQRSISVTMRTQGNDEELSLGFLITEGIIEHAKDLLSIKHCGEVKQEEKNNIIRAELKPEINVDWKKLDRHFYTTSSCGVCGKSSIEAVRNNCLLPIKTQIKIQAKTILQLAEQLNNSQLIFNLTGGIHASALFDEKGTLLLIREDVGRHNALDKIIGACATKNELPLSENILLLSGRISFELVQKSAIAGIPIIAAFGAPSSLAVDLAEEMNITLIGFLKKDKFNIYTGNPRIQ